MPKSPPARASLLVFGLVTACGSSSSSPATDGGGTSDASGTNTVGDGGGPAVSCTGSSVTWKDDGTAVCASSVVASGLHGGVPGNPDDSLLVVALDGLSIGLTIGVSAPPPLGGTYDCNPGPNGFAEVTYRDSAAASTTVVSCALTVTLTTSGDGGADAGAVEATGAFSAVLTVPDAGTTKNITGGMFDVPVHY